MNDLSQPTAAQLVAALPTIAVSGPLDVTVTAATYASADVIPGAAFVAVPGRRADGHAYIPDALARGAVLVVGEQPKPADFPADRAYAQVADARRELGALSAAFYGDPSRQMDVIGVTGTDGKTTTSSILHWLLLTAGWRVGLMSTVDVKIGAETFPNKSRFTTLEAPEVQGQLRRMVEAGVECAVVETTSSGLALHRVWGVAYDLAVITNITSEHLEVHGSLEAYKRAKAMLFETVDPNAPAKPVAFSAPRGCVLNADDPSYSYLKDFCRAPVTIYGVEAQADVRAEHLVLRPDGSSFTVRLPDGQTFRVETPLVARYNVSNCLAAITVGYLRGVAPEVMTRALATFPGVPGRMERVEAGQPYMVVVDYAHTADSLEKALSVLRPLTAGRLIVVFGSAGERDRVKRPEMGKVAAHLADFAVITDEDPREEDAMTILREIAAGAEAAGAREGERFARVVDRRKGIQVALKMAREGDVILLAGKGHEQSIFVGKEKLPWDDPTVARETLAALGYTGIRE
jgi:UDP-N-acetylmuramoyl-L-alanyl-D-glutamate--2,6-diaminopimelate ligase